jgi:iron complex outermembrane receptor protein
VQSEVKNTNAALFARADWYVNEDLTVFGGLRLLRDKVSANAFRGGRDLDLFGNLLIDHTSPRVENSDSETKLLGKIGAQYYFSEDFHLYAFTSNGYKGKSFSVEFGFDPVSFVTTEPVASERSATYEVGLKSYWFDRRLRANLVAYHTQIKDLQIGLRDLDTIANVLGSVPKTVNRGIEFTFDSLLQKNLSINGGVVYNQANFDDFPNGLCYLGQTESQGCVNGFQNSTGRVLENSPEWRAQLSAVYQWGRLTKNTNGYLQGSYRWQSKSYLSDDGDPAGHQDAYSIFDLSLGIISNDGRWNARLYAKNIFDQQYVAGVSPNSADGGGVIVHTITRDFNRYVGLSFEYLFTNVK